MNEHAQLRSELEAKLKACNEKREARVVEIRICDGVAAELQRIMDRLPTDAIVPAKIYSSHKAQRVAAIYSALSEKSPLSPAELIDAVSKALGRPETRSRIQNALKRHPELFRNVAHGAWVPIPQAAVLAPNGEGRP